MRSRELGCVDDANDAMVSTGQLHLVRIYEKFSTLKPLMTLHRCTLDPVAHLDLWKGYFRIHEVGEPCYGVTSMVSKHFRAAVY